MTTATEIQPSERELDMATALVESLSAPFEPEKYHDEYREKLLRLIEAKADGEVVTVAAPEHEAPVVDLMAALEASLAAAKGGQSAPKGGRKSDAGAEGDRASA